MRVSYVLNDGDYNSTGLLVNFFVTPKWIETIQLICDNIVEPQKNILKKSYS